jgi:hypothetical protein
MLANAGPCSTDAQFKSIKNLICAAGGLSEQRKKVFAAVREKLNSGLRTGNLKPIRKPFLEEPLLKDGIPRTTSYIWRRLLPHAILSSTEAVALVGVLPSDEELLNLGAKFRLSDLLQNLRVIMDLEHLQISPDDFYPGDNAHHSGTEGTVFVSKNLQTQILSQLQKSWDKLQFLEEWLQSPASDSDMEAGGCRIYIKMQPMTP